MRNPLWFMDAGMWVSMALLVAFWVGVTVLVFAAGCDEGDVSVNNYPDATDSTLVTPCEPETVWAQMPCPPDTVWITDPFWECIKKCEKITASRKSRGYRDCMEDCLDGL